MKRSAASGRVKVTADGEGIVSHAGAELLRETAQFSGLAGAWDAALLGTYKALPIHFPGRVLSDMAVGIADGADSISDLQVLRDQPQLFGPVASTPTAWRALDRVSPAHLPLLRQGRAMARAAAWAAGAGPDLEEELCLDIDATVLIAHSDKETAEPTWKKTYGFHPLLCYLDRPEVSSGEALSGIVRNGGAGSNTAADHIKVLDLALSSLPEEARPRKDGPNRPRICVRSDAAGATHDFAAHCRTRGVAFSFGFPITQDVRDAIEDLTDTEWWEAIDDEEGEVRDGAWVAEVTEMLDLEAWPKGSRVVVRKERPHPGAQLSLFDMIGGFRHTAFIFAPRSERETITTGIDALELRHREHARVEDRIRQGKAAGLRNLPCKEVAENNVWLELVLAAADLVCWSKLICFHDDEELARCEIAAFRYRILHIAARLTRSARVTYLRLDKTWNWAKQLALAFTRLRAAFA
ncbi:MAG: IS1380 family transposase [Acidimicrobiales bacterium]